MKISNLQIRDAKSWSGITTQNHLGAIFEQKPQVASELLGTMLAMSYGTTLESMLNKIPIKYLDSGDDFIWKLIGSSERNIALTEARYQGSVVTEDDFGIGAEGTEFELVYTERLFAPTDVIVGEKNEKYPIRISNEYQEGSNTVYVCETYGADIHHIGIPGEELVSGKLFSKEYSPVSDTLSVRGGETTFTSPITFRNSFTDIRKQYTVPGNVIDRKFVMSFNVLGPDGKKKPFTTWLQYQAFVCETQFLQEKNRALFYGKSTIDKNGRTSNVDNFSGHELRAGFGLRDQMEVANTFYYNNFSADFITNVLMELSEGKLPLDDRSFVIRTGERGAVLFHKAIAAEASGWTPLFDQSAQSQAKSELHDNSRKFGFQYTEFLAPNGIKVRVEVDPSYSDPTRNKLMAPNNGNFIGGLAEAYRMDIFDIGTTDGEPNIQKVMPGDLKEDITAYIPGIRDPYSPTGGRTAKLSANSVDGFELHKMAKFGVMVKDPSRTASLIPAILY